MAEEAAPGFDIRKVSLIGGVIFVLLFAGLFFLFRGCASAGRNTGYTVIYSNLALKDAANVVARLKELAIPYEIKEEGQAVAVPKARAAEARLGLAEKNLPAGGVVGWEIFDESKLGATDFDRRIQLIRAISGELSRTIRRIQAVEDVRVQIVLPETRLFAATVAPVTASVLLRIRPGAELLEEKINGIVHLVASSVENLQPENVTVIDNTGRILTAQGEFSSYQKRLEEMQEQVAIIEEILPSPEVFVSSEVATLPATLSIEEKILLKIQAKKELEQDLSGKAQQILNSFYPPSSVIVKVSVELANLPSREGYDIRHLEREKISAIILVDNRVDLSAELKESTFKTVAAAIGYNRKREDKILLQKVPFHLASPPPAVVRQEIEKVFPEKEKTSTLFWWPAIFWGSGITLLLVIIIFAVARIRKPKAVVDDSVISNLATPRPSKKTSSLEKVRSMAENNPEKIAELLKNWLAG